MVLAGGCFWGQQAVFEHVKGVTRVVAGYSGGAASTANYPLVTTETTGHAKSVEITFDPKLVSFGRLLQVYFSVAHDPTELNFQGPDAGQQLSLGDFLRLARAGEDRAGLYRPIGRGACFRQPIVTKVEPLKGFYPAEGYHQDYLIHNPNQPYIVYQRPAQAGGLKAGMA